MRAHTITTKSRARRKARYSVLALALGVCALAIPATASGDSTQPDDDGAVAAGNAHRTPTELAQTTSAGEPSDSSRPSGGGAVAAGNAHRTPTELAQTTAAGEPSGSGGSGVVDSGYALPNEILRGAHEPSTAEPTFVSDSAGTTGEGFDWASAAVGAGAAMALVALAGAALLTIRRRVPVSPSAPTS
jgi:hypothetical protein